MDKVRVKGVGCADKYGRREVVTQRKGVRHYYGVFDTLAEANARARDVWRLLKATGHMPVVLEEGDRPIGECPLAPNPDSES